MDSAFQGGLSPSKENSPSNEGLRLHPFTPLASTGARKALQLNQAPHVVGKVLKAYARPRPYKTDTANQSPAHVVVLRPEDMLYPCPKP